MLFGRGQKNPIKITDKKIVEWKYATCGYCSTGMRRSLLEEWVLLMLIVESYALKVLWNTNYSLLPVVVINP